MSSASEEYIHQRELEEVVGSIHALPSPMTQAQADWICELLSTSILATVQKNGIMNLVNSGNLTTDHAAAIIKALKTQQNNPLNRIREGETLSWEERKLAITKACEDPNS